MSHAGGPSGTTRADDRASGAGAVARVAPLDWRAGSGEKVVTVAEVGQGVGMASALNPDRQFMERMLRKELAGETAAVDVGPFTAMLLAAAIQHTLRTGVLPGGREMAEAAYGPLLNQLSPMLEKYPMALDIIRQQRDQSPG